MFDELKKSISAILYERTTSPLFGSFILSWTVWNWKIFYITLFISEDKIIGNKIDYILNNFWNNHYIFWYPIISTILLLTVVPFISNGAYWLSMNFENWKIEKKKNIERTQLLSFEQSLALREEISLQQTKFENMLNAKEFELNQYKGLLTKKEEDVKKMPKSKKPKSSQVQHETKESDPKTIENEEILKFAEDIIRSEVLKNQFKKIVRRMQGGYQLRDDEISDLVGLLEGGEYIVNTGDGKYQLTPKGKKAQAAIFKSILS